MTKPINRKSHFFDRPGNYRIRVRGTLDKGWSEKLGGMYISINKREDQSAVATMVGLMQDQAELAGVLNTLYELSMPLLSVEYLDGE